MSLLMPHGGTEASKMASPSPLKRPASPPWAGIRSPSRKPRGANGALAACQPAPRHSASPSPAQGERSPPLPEDKENLVQQRVDIGRSPRCGTRSWWQEQQEQPLSMRELQARLEAERSSLTISVREFHAQQMEVTGSLTRNVEQKFASAMDAIDNLSSVTEGSLRAAVLRLEARCAELEARSLASEDAEDVHQQPQPQLQSAQQRCSGKAGHVDEKNPDLLEVLKDVCSDIEQLQGQCGQINNKLDSLQTQQSTIRHDLQSHLETLVAEVQSQLSSDAWEIQSQITGDMSQLMGEVEALRVLHSSQNSELENVRRELKERFKSLTDLMSQHDQNSRMTDEVVAGLCCNLQVLQKNQQITTDELESLHGQRAEHEGALRNQVQATREDLNEVMKALRGTMALAQTEHGMNDIPTLTSESMRALADQVKQHHDANLEVLRTQLHQEIESVRSSATMSRQPSFRGTLQSDLHTTEALHTVQALQRRQSSDIDELQCEGREHGNELREMRKQIGSEMQKIWKAQQENAESVSGKVEALQGKVNEDHQSLKASEVSQAQLSGTIRAVKNNFKVLQIQQSRHTGEIEVLQADLRRRSMAESLAAG